MRIWSSTFWLIWVVVRWWTPSTASPLWTTCYGSPSVTSLTQAQNSRQYAHSFRWSGDGLYTPPSSRATPPGGHRANRHPQ